MLAGLNHQTLSFKIMSLLKHLLRFLEKYNIDYEDGLEIGTGDCIHTIFIILIDYCKAFLSVYTDIFLILQISCKLLMIMNFLLVNSC